MDTQPSTAACNRGEGAVTTDAPLFRLSIEPRPSNGLKAESRPMVDKITTVRRTKWGDQTGVLDDADVIRLNRALVVFLGIAASV